MLGKVTLVGAGPGDSQLLTLKAKEALLNADVVLYDRLVGVGILAMIPASAQCINVGKNPNNHPVSQEEINRLILHQVSKGKDVVRLKGGDPYLFGRGAEELEALVDLGVEFEVIPGVTSAVSVPAYGGIPVTHRDFSSSLHILTAHGKRNENLNHDYQSLVKLGGTLVFMMGVGELENICIGLLSAGISPEMPAALVENGSTNRQRTLISTIEEIPQKAVQKGFKPPCVFVVGQVCSLGEKLNWFEKKPLAKVSLMVAKSGEKPSELSKKLRELGAFVSEISAIQTKPVAMSEETAREIGKYDWLVFTSKVGVEVFTESLAKNKVDIRTIGRAKIAAVGAQTEKFLNTRGLLVDYSPEIFDGEHLAEGLESRIKKGDKVLLYRSAIGRKLLAERLEKLGAEVEDMAAYETDFHEGEWEHLAQRILKGEVDYILFTSGSTVEGFTKGMGMLDFSKIKCVCIGEQTAKAARSYGMKVFLSQQCSTNSMTERILELTKGERA